MSKRRVATSRTTGYYNWLTGQRVATTKTYVHDEAVKSDRQSKRWSAKRIAGFLWLLVFLAALGTSTASGLTFLAVSLLVVGAYAGRKHWARVMIEPERVEPPKPEPGPVWCDHCAEWTVHETAEHAAV